MKDVAVVAYCRTGIARAVRGALNQTRGIPMTAHVLRHAVERAGIDPTEVEDVVVAAASRRGTPATTSRATPRSRPASGTQSRE